MKNANKFHLS